MSWKIIKIERELGERLKVVVDDLVIYELDSLKVKLFPDLIEDVSGFICRRLGDLRMEWEKSR